MSCRRGMVSLYRDGPSMSSCAAGNSLGSWPSLAAQKELARELLFQMLEGSLSGADTIGHHVSLFAGDVPGLGDDLLEE